MPANKLLTVHDVCQRLSLSRSTVHLLTLSGELRARRLRGAVRYSEADVAELIERAARKASVTEDDSATPANGVPTETAAAVDCLPAAGLSELPEGKEP